MSELKNTIKTLTAHNVWRRGDVENMPQLSPKDIGLAIDHAVKVLIEVEYMMTQSGHQRTWVAYRRLELAATE